MVLGGLGLVGADLENALTVCSPLWGALSCGTDTALKSLMGTIASRLLEGPAVLVRVPDPELGISRLGGALAVSLFPFPGSPGWPVAQPPVHTVRAALPPMPIQAARPFWPA